jgi:transposase-like protein
LESALRGFGPADRWHGSASRQELAREVQRLRQELAQVKMQRDILKKTIGIVAEAPGKGTL